MRSKTFLACLLLISIFSTAQEKTEEAASDSVKAWSINAQNSFMINQSSFSNWVGGGANNVGWLAGVNYNLTYDKDKDLWENIIILGFGQNKTQGIGVRKTQDVINLSTNYGREISDKWYVSAGAGFISQFKPGYEDGNNPEAKKISDFMAPGYLSVGTGFTYKPNDNLMITLRPANARWTFVLDKELQYAGSYGLKEDGDTSLFQFGFLGTIYYKLNIMENITLTNNTSVFSNYLDQPSRLVLSYGGILKMKINKFISTNVTLDLLYDHNQIQKTQIKQTLGVGLAYHFEKGKKPSGKKISQAWRK